MPMTVSQWVVAARTHKGWTQTQLGEAVQRTKANVSSWEAGRHEPSFDQILRISHATGYPLDSLFPAAKTVVQVGGAAVVNGRAATAPRHISPLLQLSGLLRQFPEATRQTLARLIGDYLLTPDGVDPRILEQYLEPIAAEQSLGGYTHSAAITRLADNLSMVDDDRLRQVCAGVDYFLECGDWPTDNFAQPAFVRTPIGVHEATPSSYPREKQKRVSAEPLTGGRSGGDSAESAGSDGLPPLPQASKGGSGVSSSKRQPKQRHP